jgi:hypothetical protein
MRKVGALHIVSVFLGLVVGCSTEDPAAETEGAQSEVAVTQAPSPPGNPNGKGAGGECVGGGDCKSGVCNAAKCTPPELDVGRGCAGPADCESKVCVATVCEPAKIDDGVKNGDETDVDCGGPGVDVPRCADEKACVAATDCTSEVCDPAAKTCSKPSATDGVKNAATIG